MKREIKFRAWEAIEKRFLSWEEVQENTIQDVFRLFDCQQFTGFKDMNGVDIYEGDILRPINPGRYKGPFIVKWDTKSDIAGWTCEHDEGSKGIIISVCDWAHREVIGNIHEHPELLGGGL